MKFKIKDNQLLCEDGSIVVERDYCDLEEGQTIEEGLLSELEWHKFWLQDPPNGDYSEYEDDEKEFERMQKEFLPIVLAAIEFLKTKEIRG